jgi:glycerol transport system ATP-binding protein
MVYQQFINYPSFTVYENIASPLKLQRHKDTQIKQRVGEIAETLRLTPYLDRRPAELSGGQQQRTALARALAKDAELLLLDEPLVNLDYKLREELRQELGQLFRNERTTIVYATTEPQEALQLGGNTAILDAGKLLQVGPTFDIFLRPTSLAAARAFSDPPLNMLHPDSIPLPASFGRPPSNGLQLGIRAHHIRVQRHRDTDIAIGGKVDLAEISGSDTYLHFAHRDQSLVAQLPGVHDFAIGATCTLYVDPADLYGFDAQGDALFTPAGV